MRRNKRLARPRPGADPQPAPDAPITYQWGTIPCPEGKGALLSAKMLIRVQDLLVNLLPIRLKTGDQLEVRIEHHRRGSPIPGICRVCGCTDEQACLQGCAWADKTKTLCTTCVSVACMVGI